MAAKDTSNLRSLSTFSVNMGLLPSGAVATSSLPSTSVAASTGTSVLMPPPPSTTRKDGRDALERVIDAYTSSSSSAAVVAANGQSAV